MTESGRALNVAVIGAGAAGLVAARELQREGHSVQVYENSPGLGGIWNYQEEIEDDLLGRDPHRHIVHSSLYASLRVNLPREIMSYTDFPFIPEAMAGRSKDARRFPHHTEVLAYLEAFADQFDLRPLIRFDTQVVRLEQSMQPHNHAEHEQDRDCSGQTQVPKRQTVQAGWRVISEPASSAERQEGHAKQTEEEFEAVVVAIGNYHEPNLPDIAGMDAFPGLQLHCHNFRHNEPFRDQRVLVVGASYSGIELANHVADVAQRVFHSARTWGSNNDPEQTKPNLERVPMLTHLSPDASASFGDGQSISNIDSVIYCTGYQYKYRFLEHLNLISTDEMHVHPLYKHIFVPSVAPTLAFIGLLWKSLRNIQFETQVRWVAQVLSGKAILPSEAAMMEDVNGFYTLRAEHGVPLRYTHCQTAGMPVTQWEYNEDLRQACHPPPPPAEQWRVDLHEQSASKILGEPNTFRDAVTPEDEAHFERARAACLQMWQQLQALSSSQHCKRVTEQLAAKHADGALLRACQT